LIDRFLGGMGKALANSLDNSLFGMGIGMGTNVGAVLLSGSLVFLVDEGEWGRLIGELGPLLGLAIILMRLMLTFKMSRAAYSQLSTGHVLPWLLLSATIIPLAQGQWAQPTSLGFSVLAGGLLMASLKGDDNEEVNTQTHIEDPLHAHHSYS
jgi:hypothetical protein